MHPKCVLSLGKVCTVLQNTLRTALWHVENKCVLSFGSKSQILVFLQKKSKWDVVRSV